MICVGIEWPRPPSLAAAQQFTLKADPAQRGEKQSGGLFFRPWEIPRIPERSPQDCETESGFVRVTTRKSGRPMDVRFFHSLHIVPNVFALTERIPLA